MKPLYTLLIGAIAGFLTAFLLFWNSPGDQKGRPFTIKSNKPFYQTQKLPKGTSTQAGALFSSNRLKRDTPLVKKDIKGPVQGKVTLIDWCSGVVFIDDVPFNKGYSDLNGIQTGDRVEVTYTDPKQGKVKVMESIHLLH
jgi:hypothetical protein